MQSLESSALEPTKADLAGASLRTRILRFLPVYGLVILTAFLIILFSILLPNTFPTLLNVRSIISDKAIIALLSLGAMIPMAAGRIDLTVGYGIVLWHILAISLQTMLGLPWPVAVAVVLALGLFAGFLNGLLVEVAKIDSFIATLGTGTVLYALALWHTGGRQMVGVLPEGFLALNGTFVFGLPITGFLTALAGVLPASKLRIGQASVGLEFLLPALVGAFLGSTTIKPGRVNVWGTIIGVVILAVGISGIQQFGGSFWVEPLFNGVTLLIAIGIAGYAQRRKGADKRKTKREA